MAIQTARLRYSTNSMGIDDTLWWKVANAPSCCNAASGNQRNVDAVRDCAH